MANDHIISTQKACGSPSVNTTMIKFNEAFVEGQGNVNIGYHCVHTWPGNDDITNCCVTKTDSSGPSDIEKTFQEIAQAIVVARTAGDKGTGTFADPYQLALY